MCILQLFLTGYDIGRDRILELAMQRDCEAGFIHFFTADPSSIQLAMASVCQSGGYVPRVPQALLAVGILAVQNNVAIVVSFPERPDPSDSTLYICAVVFDRDGTIVHR